LKSKLVALITGATSGIGEATAYRLHDRGYTVFATGRNPEALDTLRSKGLQARPLDVTDESAASLLVEEIQSEHGGVDVLVNSAGYPLPCPLEQVALDDLRKLFETNVVATLHLSQAILPGMRARGSGRIVTIGSTGGRFTSPGAGAYHTVKYAVEALSLSLGAEVAPFGVRVVLIDPTGVRTPFVSSQFETEHSYPDDDPYGDFKIRYAETTRRLAKAKGTTVGADTVARAVVRVVKAKNPKPRYIVGASGRAGA
jgi:NAD(P)-dependent dehydrogenase (short-subunit alcohol dehydrogenase family)